MNKNHYKYLIPALALILAIPGLTHAQNADLSVSADATVQADAPANPVVMPASSNNPGTIRDRIRADYKSRVQNAQNNEQTRNTMVEHQIITPSAQPAVQVISAIDTTAGDNATSTSEHQDSKDDPELHAFKLKQNALVKQLVISIENLKQISGRIDTRIQKAETSGIDMSIPKGALAVANTKIAAAELAASTTANFSPVFKMNDATSTIDLTKPRQVLSDSIQAVNEARNALNDAVQALIKAIEPRTDVSPAASASLQ